MNGKQAAATAIILIIAIPILAGYAFASETTQKTQLTEDSTVNVSDLLLNSSSYYYVDYSGPQNNSLLLEGDGSNSYTFTAPAYISTGTTETSIPLGAAATSTITTTAGEYTSLSSFSYSTWSFSATDAYIKLTYADDSTETLYITGDFLKIGSTFVAKEGGYNPSYSYPLVSDVAVMFADATTITLNYYLPGTTTFADPSYGWSIPDSTYTYNWANGFSNDKVTFYLHMDAPASGTYTATFSPHNGTYDTETDIYFMLSSAGVMTIAPEYLTDTYTLGTYTDVMIVYDLDEGTCTVSGIAAWPAMGGTPTTYNSVSFDTYELGDYLPMVCIAGETSAVWRCDSAHVVAGAYPITDDYSLSMGDFFPDVDAFHVKLTSIGIYGDTLTIGGTDYTVTDGTITVDGETVKLKGAVIEASEDSGVWSVNINGEEIAAGLASVPSIVFGGVWSLTATASLLVEETVEVNEWAPGAFAFDKDNFVLMMLLVAVGVFVALGFTGGRSGAKVLALLITCGGAAAIALMIV